MADDAPHPAALMIRSHRFSLIWIIPLTAAIAAGWLGWRSYVSHGPTITIVFENAAGIEPGRTRIKYKDADVGIVKSIKLASDLAHVVVTARMGNVIKPYLTKGAWFWVVKPSLSGRDIAGLGTFISGAYIEFEPSKNAEDKNKPSKHFIGEQSPAFIPADEPGEAFILHTEQLGPIQQGSPVYFHGMRVGQVLGYELSDKDGSAIIHLSIHAPHNALVHTGTRFWNTSGVSVGVGSTGLRIQLESIQSLLTGGIAFDIPPNSLPGTPAGSNASFTLYPDEATAQDSIYTKRIKFLLHFTDPVPGLVIGSPVRMQGLTIGQVTSVYTEYDAENGHLAIPVTIEVEADRLGRLHSNNNSDLSEKDAYGIFRKLVSTGLRARLGSVNMLTGQKVIDLNIVAGTPQKKMTGGGIYPEIPTLEADDIDSVIHSAKNTLNAANSILSHADVAISDGENGGDLAGMLREFKNAARSMRELTDYLEAHPESVIRGKPKDKAQ